LWKSKSAQFCQGKILYIILSSKNTWQKNIIGSQILFFRAFFSGFWWGSWQIKESQRSAWGYLPKWKGAKFSKSTCSTYITQYFIIFNQYSHYHTITYLKFGISFGISNSHIFPHLPIPPLSIPFISTISHNFIFLYI
jgi:hypothetical protein